MKRTALLLLLGLSAFAVQAHEPAAPAAPVAGEAAVDPAADEATVITADATAKSDKRCIRDTGTRIKRRDKDGCTGAPGESYDQDDLRHTGATNTADALRMLSPKIGG